MFPYWFSNWTDFAALATIAEHFSLLVHEGGAMLKSAGDPKLLNVCFYLRGRTPH